jgi:hypothetical protein
MDATIRETPFGRYIEDDNTSYALIKILMGCLTDADFPENVRPLDRSAPHAFVCSLLGGFATHKDQLGLVEFCGCTITPHAMAHRLAVAFKEDGDPAGDAPYDADTLGHTGFNIFIAIACALTSHDFDCDVGTQDDSGGVEVDYHHTASSTGVKIVLGSQYWRPFFRKRATNGSTVAAQAAPLTAIEALRSVGDPGIFVIMTAECIDATGGAATKAVTLKFADKAHYTSCREGGFDDKTAVAFDFALPPGWHMDGSPEPSRFVGPTSNAVDVALN